MARTRPKILLDCDPGHDDAVAIIVAAYHAELIGITTVHGNAPLEATTRNALIVRDLIGADVPIHSGTIRPLLAVPKYGAFVHGESGLDGADLPEPSRERDGTDAVGFIIDECRAADGDLWLVPVGPLTNIALALRQAPDIADHIAGISIMGGGTYGNRTPSAEFNIWADPEAAAIVFSAPTKLIMAGLDLTHKFILTTERIEQVRAVPTRLTTVLADLFEFFSGNYISRHYHMRGAALHDPCAVLAITHPDLFTGTNRHVEVEVGGSLTVGQTVIDRRGLRDAPAPNTYVLDTIDSDAAWQTVIAAISAVGATTSDVALK